MMPTYMLEGSSRVHLSDRPLSLTLRTDAPAGTVHLKVTQNGRELDSVIRRPGFLIVPRVDGRTVISVAPQDQERFPAPTVVNLSVAVEDRSTPDPERA